MTKRAIIVHGWGGNPQEGWFPWLKDKLKDCGVDVVVLAMPDPETPKIGEWVPFLYEQINGSDENTFFIGHSIGCQTILRYLEKISNRIGGAIFVAGWFNLKGLNEEEKKIAEPWTELNVNFEKVKQNINKLVVFLSSNDPYVDPVLSGQMFKTILGAKVIEERDRGHYSGEDNIIEFPSLLEEAMKMLDVRPSKSMAIGENDDYKF